MTRMKTDKEGWFASTYKWAGCDSIEAYHRFQCMRDWAYDHLANCDDNVSWAHVGSTSYFKFLKSDDALFFALRWPNYV